MEHFGFLFAAYSIIFAAIFLYVIFIWRRQSALDKELRALEAKLAEMEKKGSEGKTGEG
ncbi:MAG: CcmD family protein [Candidatus Binatus sp.]|uniref:CcmD family protein n=1 Tax=Candidatus Binatus sp. TaxID=2811406 RepID=UPI002726FCEA|nr:CcmD family protein [Candidatus Binatus sp.]MDO8433317.1 CcmD family protein [Candidatus Binatus sp.]